MSYVLQAISIALLAWIGLSLRELVALIGKLRQETLDQDFTEYPAYSRSDILNAYSETEIASKSHKSANQRVDDLQRQMQNPEQLPAGFKQAIKTMWETHFDWTTAWAEYLFLIESNIKVINGRNTIKEVLRERRQKFGPLVKFDQRAIHVEEKMRERQDGPSTSKNSPDDPPVDLPEHRSDSEA